ncbi:LPS export ABC transporter permease LptF [Nitratireductor sp. GCM10026969]|uniref:LPS export ABC transporter permease LptF n=1 Tax=Nitratireductor sp. GCM10026969 TaxID=3252645 RepID=UPI003608FEB1
MRVMEYYILRRTLAIFAAALAWVLVIVWTTQVLNRLDIVTSNGQSVATFFAVAALALPAVIPIIMPFAIGIAVAHTLATMNADSELVVINAAGSPRSTIIRPILTIAIISSIAAFAINNTLEPFARQALRQTLASANADLIATLVQEGTFQKVDDGIFVQISERRADGQLGGIFVVDTRAPDMKLIYHARRGATVERETGSVLVLQDGEIQRQSGSGDVSIIRFESLPMDLSQFTNGSDRPTLYPKDQYLPYLLNPDPEDKFFAEYPQAFRAELHMRLSEWLYPIVFALIGIAVAGDARSFREARLHPLVTTLAIGLAVRWAGFYAGNEAESVPFFSFMLYAVPIGTIIICIGFIASNRVMELPTHWVERLSARFQRDREALAGFGARTARRFGPRGRA